VSLVGALLCEIREIITAAYGGRRSKLEHLEIPSDYFEIVLWKSVAGLTSFNYSQNLLIKNARFFSRFKCIFTITEFLKQSFKV
jgi:hypothetical protein